MGGWAESSLDDEGTILPTLQFGHYFSIATFILECSRLHKFHTFYYTYMYPGKQLYKHALNQHLSCSPCLRRISVPPQPVQSAGVSCMLSSRTGPISTVVLVTRQSVVEALITTAPNAAAIRRRRRVRSPCRAGRSCPSDSKHEFEGIVLFELGLIPPTVVTQSPRVDVR